MVFCSRRGFGLGLTAVALSSASPAVARSSERPRRGLFISLGTLLDTEKLDGLIRLACAFGVESFVVDVGGAPAVRQRALGRIRDAGIDYVPRVLVFPGGGSDSRVKDFAYWEARSDLIASVLDEGAPRVQLDYVRYESRGVPDPQHSMNILHVVRYLGGRIHERGARFEIDVFGEATGGPSHLIGQDLRLLGPYVDAVCPMAYPSHYRPYEETWKIPYEVVERSVRGAKRLMGPEGPPVRAYVEMFNARRFLPEPERATYIRRQVQGAIAGGAVGWYAWSVTNSYGLLFDLLAAYGDEFEWAV